MIRNIHSIKNIFRNHEGASSFSHLYIHKDANETNEEDQLQTPNLFVAVSKASTCHVFFYYIDENEKVSRKSKLLGIRSKILSSEDVLTVNLISNGSEAPVLMALTQYGKLLISDTLSPNTDISIHPIVLNDEMSLLGMNIMELKQTLECRDRLTFVIGGSNSLSPPAIAFSKNCDFKDYKSLRDLNIETKEIQGLENVTARLTTMSYFDVSILQPELRNHLIRLWKNYNTGHENPSMDSIDSAVVLGYSDGSVYLAFVEHISTHGSIYMTQANKILHMNTPQQRIVSICLTHKDGNSSDGIVFIGHLYGIAFIHMHNQDPVFVQNSSTNYFGMVNHAQVIPSFSKNDDGHNLLTNKSKGNVHIIVTTSCGKSSSANFSLFNDQRHKSIEFQETSFRKDIDWIGLHSTRANAILIFVTITGLLKIAATGSSFEANSNCIFPSSTISGCTSETEDISALLDAIKKVPKPMDNSPQVVKSDIFEKLRRATELLSGDISYQALLNGTSHAHMQEQQHDLSIRFVKNTIHVSQSLSNHLLKSATVNDLGIKGYRENFPIVYGGHSQSFYPAESTNMSDKEEEDKLQVLWNGFNRFIFSSSCIIFHDNDNMGSKPEGCFINRAVSWKPNGLVVPQNERKRTMTSMEHETNPTNVNDRHKQARYSTSQSIKLQFFTVSDATLLRNQFCYPHCIPGLKCKITSPYQHQENLTAHLEIEGENRDVSIAICLLESAAKSFSSTSMRNDNNTFTNETRNIDNFLSDEIARKSVAFLYNLCKHVDLTESHNKSILDLHAKIRSLPLFSNSNLE